MAIDADKKGLITVRDLISDMAKRSTKNQDLGISEADHLLTSALTQREKLLKEGKSSNTFERRANSNVGIRPSAFN